jgi:hypothetical protein
MSCECIEMEWTDRVNWSDDDGNPKMEYELLKHGSDANSAGFMLTDRHDQGNSCSFRYERGLEVIVMRTAWSWIKFCSSGKLSAGRGRNNFRMTWCFKLLKLKSLTLKQVNGEETQDSKTHIAQRMSRETNLLSDGIKEMRPSITQLSHLRIKLNRRNTAVSLVMGRIM